MIWQSVGKRWFLELSRWLYGKSISKTSGDAVVTADRGRNHSMSFADGLPYMRLSFLVVLYDS